jgi:hypothetical protein
MYSEDVLAIYNTVLFSPGVVTFTEFEVTGLPLPNNPIWLYDAGLHVAGWQIAEIDAEPA